MARNWEGWAAALGALPLRTVLQVWLNGQPPLFSKQDSVVSPRLLSFPARSPKSCSRALPGPHARFTRLGDPSGTRPPARAARRTHTHAHLQYVSAGGGSCASALRLTPESAGSPKSNVSDNFPLHQQSTRTTKVPLYLGSSFNMIYAFCARNCGIFPHGKQYGNVKNRNLPARVHVRTPG